MVAFSFNAQQFQPNYGGGGGANLPPGTYKGVIADMEPVNTKDQAGNIKGGYMAITLTPIEGPLVGQKHIDRLNLHHTNPKTVEIANEQMSAYCHVVGVFNIQDTAQLYNKPMQFEIGWQKGQEPSAEKPTGGYTEVKAIYDINGNPPGKAGAGPQVAQQPAPVATAPPAQVAAVGVQPAAWGAPAAEQQQPAPVQPAAAGWGAPPAGQVAPPAAWGGPPA